MKKFILLLTAFIFAMLAAFSATAAETKFVSSTGTVYLAFGPDQFSGQEITAVLAKSDSTGGAVKYYTVGGAGKKAITSASTSGAVAVNFVNTGNLITTNDFVVYWHASGAVVGGLVTANTATSATINVGISTTGTTNDAIYEVTQRGEINTGTTALNLAGFTVFAVPPGSPALFSYIGTNTAVLTVTKK
jgi:hypothetical protein